jgi:hypothetical protein
LTEENTLEVEAGATVEGKPFIRHTWGDRVGQLSPAQGIQLGMGYITAAIEAERDAALIAFMTAEGFTPHEAGIFLFGLREHRQQYEMRAEDMAETERAAHTKPAKKGKGK